MEWLMSIAMKSLHILHLVPPYEYSTTETPVGLVHLKCMFIRMNNENDALLKPSKTEPRTPEFTDQTQIINYINT
jgi:hypothetical protein